MPSTLQDGRRLIVQRRDPRWHEFDVSDSFNPVSVGEPFYISRPGYLSDVIGVVGDVWHTRDRVEPEEIRRSDRIGIFDVSGSEPVLIGDRPIPNDVPYREYDARHGLVVGDLLLVSLGYGHLGAFDIADTRMPIALPSVFLGEAFSASSISPRTREKSPSTVTPSPPSWIPASA